MKINSRQLFVCFTALFIVPLTAVYLYLELGSPNIPDHPLQERRSSQTETMSQIQVEALVSGRRQADRQEVDPDFHALIEQLKQKIQQTGGDARGYELLGAAQARLRNHKEAWLAFQKAYDLSGYDRFKVMQLENMIAAADGYMSSESIALLKDIGSVDDFRVPYYEGVLQGQNGNLEEAANIWERMLDRPDLPPMLGQRLMQQIQQSRQEIGLNTPVMEGVEAIERMSPEERAAAIDGMVAGLAQKLEDNPNNLQGWLQLIQAYAVLKRDDALQSALSTAKNTFQNNPEAMQALEALEARVSAE
jgi:cytochrome c-type biogenesis protein CcmH